MPEHLWGEDYLMKAFDEDPFWNKSCPEKYIDNIDDSMNKEIMP